MEVEMQVPEDPHYVVAVGKMHRSVDVACKVVDDIRGHCCDNSCLVAGYNLLDCSFLDCNFLDCSIDLAGCRCFGYYFFYLVSMYSSD